MNRLCKAAKFIREELGLSVEETAKETRKRPCVIYDLENGLPPSQVTIDSYREAFGLDLYMVAVAFFTDYNNVPEPLMKAVVALNTAYKNQIAVIVAKRRES